MRRFDTRFGLDVWISRARLEPEQSQSQRLRGRGRASTVQNQSDTSAGRGVDPVFPASAGSLTDDPDEITHWHALFFSDWKWRSRPPGGQTA
jgi:hypothetical protein